MTPNRELVTSWLIELLEEHPASYPVGDNGGPETIAYPYWVVWSIPGGGLGGPPLGASAADAIFTYQVDSVGKVRKQAENQGAIARDRIIGRTAAGAYVTAKASPPGIVILDRFMDGAPGAALPEGDRPNEVWTFSERFAFGVTSET